MHALVERVRPGRRTLAGLALIIAGLLAGALIWRAAGSSGAWEASFADNAALVSNGLAYAHPNEPGVRTSCQWIVTSGSLFSDDGVGWTGPIDGLRPDRLSRRHTGSAVFRAVTRRDDFRDVTVSFDLYVMGMTTTPRTGSHAYDGVHVFLRYENPQSLYAVSVDRRDGTAAVKIKRPGGPSNGGTYTLLGSAPLAVPLHRWVHERVSVVNESGGVRIVLWSEGREVLNVLSNGTGKSAPLRSAGRVGLRGDNTEFRFRNFTVTPH